MNDGEMKITTVRITRKQKDWIRANHPNNFSNLVRHMVDDLMHQSRPVNYHNAWRENAQKCYPFTNGGYCAICWPAGVPDRTLWMDYIKSGSVQGTNPNGVIQKVDHTLTFEEWNNVRIGNRQTVLDDWNRERNIGSQEITQEEGSQAISNQEKQVPARKFGWFRRFWR